MRRSVQRVSLTVIVCFAALALMFVFASCDLVPDTDETDPVPHIFQGRELPKAPPKHMAVPGGDPQFMEMMRKEMERKAKEKQEAQQAVQKAKEPKQTEERKKAGGEEQAKGKEGN